MKTVFLPILCLLLTATACHKSDIASGIPNCIYQEIKANMKNPQWAVGAVIEYQFQGNTVYSFDPDTRIIADGASTIKDADCNILCHVGGFGGPAINQCNGENFFQTAVYKRTIWQKK